MLKKLSAKLAVTDYAINDFKISEIFCKRYSKSTALFDLIMSHSQMLGKFEYGLPAKF